jgi:hypothetical protein
MSSKTITCYIVQKPKETWDCDPPLSDVQLVYRGALIKYFTAYSGISLTNRCVAWARKNGFTHIKWVDA